MRNKAHKLVLNYSLGSRTINNTVERTENKYIIKQTKYEKLTKKKKKWKRGERLKLVERDTNRTRRALLDVFLYGATHKAPKGQIQQQLFSVQTPQRTPLPPPCTLNSACFKLKVWKCSIIVIVVRRFSVWDAMRRELQPDSDMKMGLGARGVGPEPLSCNCHEARLIMAA